MYCEGDRYRIERFQNLHHDSISPFDCGLCPQVDVRCVPVVTATSVMRLLRNSGASSEWMMSGEPWRKYSSSSNLGTRVVAWRSGSGMIKTVLVKLSIRARASVSPVVTRPWPWKSMAYRERGLVVVSEENNPCANLLFPFSFSHSSQSLQTRRTSVFMVGQK